VNQSLRLANQHQNLLFENKMDDLEQMQKPDQSFNQKFENDRKRGNSTNQNQQSKFLDSGRQQNECNSLFASNDPFSQTNQLSNRNIQSPYQMSAQNGYATPNHNIGNRNSIGSCEHINQGYNIDQPQFTNTPETGASFMQKATNGHSYYSNSDIFGSVTAGQMNPLLQSPMGSGSIGN
jgi:hypothetical protein